MLLTQSASNRMWDEIAADIEYEWSVMIAKQRWNKMASGMFAAAVKQKEWTRNSFKRCISSFDRSWHKAIRVATIVEGVKQWINCYNSLCDLMREILWCIYSASCYCAPNGSFVTIKQEVKEVLCRSKKWNYARVVMDYIRSETM